MSKDSRYDKDTAVFAVMFITRNAKDVKPRGILWRHLRRRLATGFETHSREGVEHLRGVLVAISIPIFTSQLEKAREATDLANMRSAYAECAAAILTADSATYTSAYKKVDPNQTTAGWVTSPVPDIGAVKNTNVPNTIVKGTPIYVVVKDDGSAEIVTTAPTTKALNVDD